MQRSNLAARAGAWSANRRRAAIVGWLAFVVAAIVLGSAVGTKHIPQDNNGVGESGRAQQVLYDKFRQPANEQVLIQSSTLTVRVPAFKAAVQDEIARLSSLRTVENVRSPLVASTTGEVSRDGHSVLIGFQITGSATDADKRVGASLAATAAAQRAHPGLLVEQAGEASSTKALNKSFSHDFAKSRTLSLPITLIILIVAFGALVAAAIPVLVAATGVATTLGLVALASQLAAVDQVMSETVLLIGMAVGVDYSLFYMRREREERAAGRDEQAALQAAAATSGRSVLVSGLTVMTAMAGMYLAGNGTFASMATGTIIVVAVAVLGSLTVLPALLAIPAFGLHTSVPGLQGLPDGLPIVQTINRIEAAFPGGPVPAYVVIQGKDVTSPPAQAAIRNIEQRALATGQIHQPFKVQVNRQHDVAVVSMPLSGKGTDVASYRALDTLRDDVIPATVGSAAGLRAEVTGLSAQSKDFNASMKSHAPIVFAFVLTMAFLLLLVTFRSIVLPVTAIALNLLSVGAAYGVLVLVFQHTWAQGLLGFKSTGAITSWLPLFLFVILFGLSMDYHVFIISRIREGYDKGMRTDDAIAHGIKSTAGPVTSAAVVMVAVFAIFASLGALEFKQLGIGLAVAILLDATLIRAVLLPATMKLLGNANWYLPRRLHWLPRVRHEPAPVPAREPARA
jgi:RND superfamily putative drug exporter